MSNIERIKELKQKRKTFKCKLTRFKSFIETNELSPNFTQLKLRSEKMTDAFSEYESIQNELELLDTENDHTEEVTEIENEFFNISAKAHDILTTQVASNVSNSTNLNPNSSIKDEDNDIYLPKISLPIFNGNYEDWPGFSDQFKSAVHENSKINNCKKLTYLRSCLKGDAARVIESLSNTETNYEIAWSILEKRYNQPAIIVSKHIKAIFEVKSVHKPNYKDLREFLNNIESHYRALKSLEQPSADTILIYLLMTKIDHDTACKWKEYNLVDFPHLDNFLEFLHERCKILEPLESTNNDLRHNTKRYENYQRHQNQNTKFQSNTHHSFTTQVSQMNITCAICKNNHYTQNCEQLTQVDVNERFKIVKKMGLCSNCLRQNHQSNQCKSSLCKKCNKRHHTLLHIESEKAPITSISNVSSLQAVVRSQTLLSTVVADILDNNGKSHRCRILIDNGSQSNFLTESMVSKLNLNKTSTNVSVSGIQQLIMPVNYTVNTTIKSCHNNFSLTTNFLVLPKLSEKLPSRYIDQNFIKIPKNVKLADPHYNKPGEIDAILGSTVFHKLICVGKISLLNDDIALLKTQFGLIFCGELHDNFFQKTVAVNLSVLSLQHQISKFWEIEDNFSIKFLSNEEKYTENHYSTNTKREISSGRFIVRLPFNDNKNSLGNSYTVALKRFYSLEKSLSKNTNIKQLYINFMREYSLLNHMTEIKNSNKDEGYYLPHHAVTKNSSHTTKLRVVFDGSCATSTGISLNDTLNVGPLIQEDLFSIILRFRSHQFVLTADIAKMYRQVLLHSDDRKFQKILWRENSLEPIKTYELNTVTYGTTPASYLAVKSLHKLADDESQEYPLASIIIKEDFYVDDLLTGTDTFEAAIKLRNDLISVLSKGGFPIRQWLSNDSRLTSDLKNQSNDEHFCLNFDQVSKTLGVRWQPSNDVITYLAQNVFEQRITKRTILSQIAQLFDPLGLLGPVIVKAKIIMQRLWQLQLPWDETVPLEMHTAWNNFRNQLTLINQLQFSRQILIDKPVQIQLHGFCDASERAYGACLYTRCISKDGIISVKLVCSKSRVAPLKSLSLPRLELCACLLLIKLLRVTFKSLRRLKFDKITLWSDSTIALTWISTSPHMLQSFVANRVAEIQSCHISHEWRHIASQNNPADLISRGCMPSDFIISKLWQQGPDWFYTHEQKWPTNKFNIAEIPETRKIVCFKTTTTDLSFFDIFSTFNQAKRIIALCLRFINNCAHSSSKRFGNITIDELNQATNRIIRVVQQHSFSDFFKKSDSSLKICKSNLASLNPFIDDNQILRVGGRIGLSIIPYEGKHPALLPRKSHITYLIILEQHLKNLHSGAQLTLASLREHYWITDGRNAVRNVLRKCIKCFRLNPPIPNYLMGSLPKPRVTYYRPFLHTGIDYCGPFFVKEKVHRNKGRVKVYIAVFICLSTKAIHIEVVSDLTTEAFLAALRRFFGRRGKCTDIYSDNAKNFVGANNHFKEVHKLVNDHVSKKLVNNFLTNENIIWHFSPPQSPHFGGLWEAAVKSFKNHFYRVTNNTLLSYEALSTLCIEIEAILNSRPLTPLSSDPNDYFVLTPGHFLIGTSLTTIPERDLRSIPDNRLSIWQQIKKIRQHFWHRWHKEYLHELTVRRKWHTGGTTNLETGELVLLREENLPPMNWKIGRITRIHPGKDDIVRVVTVKTANGEYTRSVKKVSPLSTYLITVIQQTLAFKIVVISSFISIYTFFTSFLSNQIIMYIILFFNQELNVSVQGGRHVATQKHLF